DLIPLDIPDWELARRWATHGQELTARAKGKADAVRVADAFGDKGDRDRPNLFAVFGPVEHRLAVAATDAEVLLGIRDNRNGVAGEPVAWCAVGGGEFCVPAKL